MRLRRLFNLFGFVCTSASEVTDLCLKSKTWSPERELYVKRVLRKIFASLAGMEECYLSFHPLWFNISEG